MLSYDSDSDAESTCSSGSEGSYDSGRRFALRTAPVSGSCSSSQPQEMAFRESHLTPLRHILKKSGVDRASTSMEWVVHPSGVYIHFRLGDATIRQEVGMRFFRQMLPKLEVNRAIHFEMTVGAFMKCLKPRYQFPDGTVRFGMYRETETTMHITQVVPKSAAEQSSRGRKFLKSRAARHCGSSTLDPDVYGYDLELGDGILDTGVWKGEFPDFHSSDTAQTFLQAKPTQCFRFPGSREGFRRALKSFLTHASSPENLTVKIEIPGRELKTNEVRLTAAPSDKFSRPNRAVERVCCADACGAVNTSPSTPLKGEFALPSLKFLSVVFHREIPTDVVRLETDVDSKQTRWVYCLAKGQILLGFCLLSSENLNFKVGKALGGGK